MFFSPKKILIVRTDRIGDVILSTPVIKNLRLFFPQSYIAFMCSPITKDIVEGNPYLDEVIVYDKKNTHRSILSNIKFTLELKKKKFDCAFILHPTNRVHIICFFAKIKVRIGWNRKLGWLLSKKIPHYKQEGSKHELEYTLDLLRAVNIPILDKSLYFPIKKEAEDKVVQLLKERGLFDKEFIVIHPSASCPSKRWPQDYFIELIHLLKEKVKLPIVIISSKEEKEFSEEIVKKSEVIDLRGLLDIAMLGSLFKRTKLLISNDSGPAHIAASIGTPLLVIFGRSQAGLSPTRWLPLGEKVFYFHKYVGCKVCLAHNCSKGFLCLKEIKPQEVFKKILEILGIK